MKRSSILIVFAFFGISFIFFGNSNSPSFISILLKTMPILFLIIYVFSIELESFTMYKNWIFLGLIFCAIGDATMHWFIIGFFFFLLGFICYIIAFFIIRQASTPKWMTLFLLIFGIILCAWVIGNIMNSGYFILAIVVTFFIAILLTLVWIACQTRKLLLIIGALLLLLSNTILSLTMFVTDIHFGRFFIVSTYYIAQFFFAISVSTYFPTRTKVLK